MGTSLQITCSMSCDEGVARVHWHGLDTNLGSVQTLPGSSVLSVRGMMSDTGTRVCVASCGSRSFQHSVKILVYGEARPQGNQDLRHTNTSTNQVLTLTVDPQG